MLETHPLGKGAQPPHWKHAPPQCFIIPNFVILSQTISAHVGVPNLWDTGSAPLGWGGADRLGTRSYPYCYRTKSGHPRSNRVGISSGSKKFGDVWTPSLFNDPVKWYIIALVSFAIQWLSLVLVS